MAEKIKKIKTKPTKAVEQAQHQDAQVASASQHKTEATAVAKYLRITPKKVNRVIKHIRGKSIDEALTIIRFLPNFGVSYITKCLNSAVANAVNNNKLKREELYVKKAHVDSGVILKRFRAGGRGSAARIQKLTCHITITVAKKGSK